MSGPIGPMRRGLALLAGILLGACVSEHDEVRRPARESAETPPFAPPGEVAGFDRAMLEGIEPLVRRALDEGRMPGCVVAVGDAAGLVYLRAFGRRSLQPTPEPMTVDTVFDLASLTKPIATATSVLQLVERGQVRLRDPLARHWPAFGQSGKDRVRVQQLLTHVGGLIPDNALDDYQHGVEEAWRRLAALSLVDEPGASFRYTDVGFEALGRMVEELSGQALDDYARERIFAPLGMRETGFRPGPSLRERAAPTERRDGRWMRGEVHDPRAHLLGGVAGHAGLFSTARDLARFARAMLQGGALDGARVLSPRLVELMGAAVEVPGGQRTLGWDKNSRFSSNRGETFSEQAFGHGGFTGTALWIDPGLDLFVIFLSNRVHPDGEGSVNELAGRIGTLAGAARRAGSLRLDGSERAVRRAGADGIERTTSVDRAAAPASADGSMELGACVLDLADGAAELRRRRLEGVRPRLEGVEAGGVEVLSGLDVLVATDFEALPPGRVGLLTNHTGRDRDGVRGVDRLHAAPNVDLVLLFSPEHGLGGGEEGKVPDGRDEATGLPIASLYGETRVPRAEDLARIDVLVFDIQDAGTRFYTYLATMALGQQACSEAGVHFVVLDRPNPIGAAIGGSRRDADAESFVAFHPVPLRHGMTAGELALAFHRDRGLSGPLRVIPVAGWARDRFYDETGLPWIDPSPNLRTVDQALLYPGIGVLEFTNLSVGRGTDTPFERVGAPWIDPLRLAAALAAAELPGLRFSPVRYTPRASKFAGEECGGVHLSITDRDRVDPIRLGWALAVALRDHFPEDWEPERFATLLADDAAFARFLGGASAEELWRAGQSSHGDFRRWRAASLIYPSR